MLATFEKTNPISLRSAAHLRSLGKSFRKMRHVFAFAAGFVPYAAAERPIRLLARPGYS